MARRTVSEDDLLEKAFALFRASGYDGVSVSDLAEAIGLEKASLYYRYEGGKEDIALAVLLRVAAWFEEHVFAPLHAGGPPRDRVSVVAENLREFYAGGTKSCVLDVLSLPGGSAKIKATIQIALQAWMMAFTEIASESGFEPVEAERRAEEAIVGIEGALVLARVLGDPSAFLRVVESLPELLTEPEGQWGRVRLLEP